MRNYVLAIPLLFSVLTAEVFSVTEQDTIDLSLSQSKDISFQVSVEMSQDALLRGNVQIMSPETASIELILFHEDDYRRWKGTGEDAAPDSDHFYLRALCTQ